jgi:hypothetical protein
MQGMSDDALAAFALPKRAFVNRMYFNAVFSGDGKQVGFITLDNNADAKAGTVTRRCIAWSYDLTNRTLSGADLPGSPFVAKIGTDLPAGFCGNNEMTMVAGGYLLAGYGATWANGDFYVVDIQLDGKQPSTPPTVKAYVLRGSTISEVPAASRPAALQAWITDRLQVRKLVADDTGSETTNDGLFRLEKDWGEGRSSCMSLELTSVQTKSRRAIATGCSNFSYLLDRERDLLIYTGEATRAFPNRFAPIVVLDLKTGRRREFPVPVVNYQPEFLRDVALKDGGVLVAYSMQGDCDASASDYSQPGLPDGQLGNTPNQSSVCFVTIPQSEVSVASRSEHTKTK